MPSLNNLTIIYWFMDDFSFAAQIVSRLVRVEGNGSLWLPKLRIVDDVLVSRARSRRSRLDSFRRLYSFYCPKLQHFQLIWLNFAMELQMLQECWTVFADCVLLSQNATFSTYRTEISNEIQDISMPDIGLEFLNFMTEDSNWTFRAGNWSLREGEGNMHLWHCR
jgi:hypothetical protein